MTEAEVIKLLKDTGAFLEGHFILRSGLHSRHYIQCALAFQHTDVLEKLGGALAGLVKHLQVQTVVSPALGALAIGQEVARQLRARFIFVEKEDGKLALRRGFTIAPGERLLVVEDVVTRGGRVNETIEIVRNAGGVVIGVAAVVDRSDGAAQFDVPFFKLLTIHLETFEPHKLPPDLAALPALKLGSK
ncbi:MAG: orotate phosphoribosyltransferase [Verrucomicrobiae bacterium]|nr:orotate phosphoribosyltransferase [Verrucomicrobiae bacterium]MCX7722364.1 orotate phosphoribosyltransferase [Verrucomicrobiae bacterium]MDW7979146.1 orotate phosphoribosyltransferase [Verrucomicrobiales bacterium]